MSHFTVLSSRLSPFPVSLVSPSPTQDIFAILPNHSENNQSNSLVFQRLEDGNRFLSIPLPKFVSSNSSFPCRDFFTWRPDGRGFALSRANTQQVCIYDFEAAKPVFTIDIPRHSSGSAANANLTVLKWLLGPSRSSLVSSSFSSFSLFAQNPIEQFPHYSIQNIESFYNSTQQNSSNDSVQNMINSEEFLSSPSSLSYLLPVHKASGEENKQNQGNSSIPHSHSSAISRTIVNDIDKLSEWNFLLLGDSNGWISVWLYGTIKLWEFYCKNANIQDIQLSIENNQLLVVVSSFPLVLPSSSPSSSNSTRCTYFLERISLTPLCDRPHEIDYYAFNCQWFNSTIQYIDHCFTGIQKSIQSIHRCISIKFDPLLEIYEEDHQLNKIKEKKDKINSDFHYLLLWGNFTESMKSFFTRFLDPMLIYKSYQTVHWNFQHIQQYICHWILPAVRQWAHRINQLIQLSRVGINTRVGYDESVLLTAQSAIELLLFKLLHYHTILTSLESNYTAFLIWIMFQSNELNPDAEVKKYFGTQYPQPPWDYSAILEFIHWELFNEANTLSFVFDGSGIPNDQQEKKTEKSNDPKERLKRWRLADGEFNQPRVRHRQSTSAVTLPPEDPVHLQELLKEIDPSLVLSDSADENSPSSSTHSHSLPFSSSLFTEVSLDSHPLFQSHQVDHTYNCSLLDVVHWLKHTQQQVANAPSKIISSALNSLSNSSSFSSSPSSPVLSSIPFSPSTRQSFSSYFKSSSRHLPHFPIGILEAIPLTSGLPPSLTALHSTNDGKFLLAFSSSDSLYCVRFTLSSDSSSSSPFSSIDWIEWRFETSWSVPVQLQFFVDQSILYLVLLINSNDSAVSAGRCRLFMFEIESFHSSFHGWLDSQGQFSMIESLPSHPILISSASLPSSVYSREFACFGRSVEFSLTRGLASVCFQSPLNSTSTGKAERRVAILDLREHECEEEMED
jgi:hypothetical protein